MTDFFENNQTIIIIVSIIIVVIVVLSCLSCICSAGLFMMESTGMINVLNDNLIPFPIPITPSPNTPRPLTTALEPVNRLFTNFTS